MSRDRSKLNASPDHVPSVQTPLRSPNIPTTSILPTSSPSVTSNFTIRPASRPPICLDATLDRTKKISHLTALSNPPSSPLHTYLTQVVPLAANDEHSQNYTPRSQMILLALSSLMNVLLQSPSNQNVLTASLPCSPRTTTSHTPPMSPPRDRKSMMTSPSDFEQFPVHLQSHKSNNRPTTPRSRIISIPHNDLFFFQTLPESSQVIPTSFNKGTGIPLPREEQDIYIDIDLVKSRAADLESQLSQASQTERKT